MKTIKCEVIQDLLPLYVDEVLSEESCEIVEEHLSDCTACTAYCEKLKGADVTLAKTDAAEDKKVIQSISKGINRQKKRTFLIAVISALVLLILLGCVGFRLVIFYFAKQVTPDVNPVIESYTEYDRKMTDTEAVQEVTANRMKLTIPADFEAVEPIQESVRYATLDAEGNPWEQVIIMEPSDVGEMNFFGAENLEELDRKPLEKYVAKKLMKGFEDLGYGIPDNYFHLAKAYYQLKEEDYSFWNWQQGFAYVICAYLKSEVPMIADYMMIYETDEVCGFIFVTDRSAKTEIASTGPRYLVIADLFSTGDMSTGHTLMLSGESLEQIYAIINTAVIE